MNFFDSTLVYPIIYLSLCVDLSRYVYSLCVQRDPLWLTRPIRKHTCCFVVVVVLRQAAVPRLLVYKSAEFKILEAGRRPAIFRF